MMNSDFVKKGIILPLVTALAVGIIAFFATGNSLGSVIPFSNNSEVLYFDGELSENAVNASAELKSGDLLGSVKSKEELPLRYEAPYSALLNECSLCKDGAGINETGASYVEIINSNAGRFNDSLSVSGSFGDMSFKKAEERTVGSRGEVFLITPRSEKSIVVFYQLKGEYGLSSDFRAIIYEEAA